MVTPLENTQTPLNLPPHPPPLPLCCPDYRRTCTAEAARPVTGAGGRASGASR